MNEDIKAYLDEELSPERAEEVEKAIQMDPSLKNDAEFMRRITASFQAMTKGPEPAGFEKAISRTSGRNRLRTTMVVASAAFAVLFVALFASKLVTAPSRSEQRGLLTRADLAQKPSLPQESAEAGNARENYNFDDAKKAEIPLAKRTQLGKERDVVRRASLTVKVANAEEAEKKATALTRTWGGFVESSESTNFEEARPSVTLTVRVPQKAFDKALDEFEKIGTRVSKSTSGEDVSAQLVDMQARLKNLRAQEETYRQILRQARRVGEVLEVQQRLSEIRGEIESMDAQRTELKGLAALATITLTLEQRPSGQDGPSGDSGWAGDSWARATQTLGGVLKALGAACIWLLVYAPLWLPALLVLALLYRKYLR